MLTLFTTLSILDCIPPDPCTTTEHAGLGSVRGTSREDTSMVVVQRMVHPGAHLERSAVAATARPGQHGTFKNPSLFIKNSLQLLAYKFQQIRIPLGLLLCDRLTSAPVEDRDQAPHSTRISHSVGWLLHRSRGGVSCSLPQWLAASRLLSWNILPALQRKSCRVRHGVTVQG